VSTEWGFVMHTPHADLLAPGDPAGDGRCEAGQWGVTVDSIVAYGPLSGLRNWAQSILDQLPDDRDGVPLVTVDPDMMRTWLETQFDEEWGDADFTLETLTDLMEGITADPAAAGWALGDDVEMVWSNYGHDGLMVGVRLSSTEQHIGMGEPLTGDDLSDQGKGVPVVDLAHGWLLLVAERVNGSYS
jgi:hypothetical protein